MFIPNVSARQQGDHKGRPYTAFYPKPEHSTPLGTVSAYYSSMLSQTAMLKTEDAMSRILIVDDEPTIADMLEEWLQEEGYDTQSASSGEEALKKLDQFTPDLFVLDLMLPGMDGLQVCRMLRADARFSHTPVILLTACDASSNRAASYRSGVSDFISKPFDADDLSSRIRTQLEKSAQGLAH